MYLPESTILMRGKVIEDFIVVRSGLERWVPRIHGKEDDTEREKVHHVAVVRDLFQELGSHETWRPNVRCVEALAVLPSQRAYKTEVDELDIEVFRQQDILGLDVSVREPLAVQIVDALQDLSEVVPGEVRAERSFLGNVRE